MHLPQTTIRNDQVRHLCLFIEQMLIASSYYLAHTRIVVRALHSLDIKFLIVALTGFRHSIDDTSCDSVRTLYIGVIEAIDPPGQSRETHHLLHFRQDTYTALLGIQLILLFEPVEFILPYILHREIQ